MLLTMAGACARSPEAKKARYLERGDRYFKQEQYRDAVIEYRNTLRIDGNNAHAIRQLGFAYYQLGQFGQSFRFLLKAEELEPENTDIPLKLATVYLLGGRLEDARGQIDRVLQREPKNLEALVLLGGAAITPVEVDAAIQRFQGVLADYQNKARLHLALGSLYARKQNLAAAEREYQTAVAREPDSVEAHVTFSRTCRLTPNASSRRPRVLRQLAPRRS